MKKPNPKPNMKSFELLKCHLRRMGLLKWVSKPNGPIFSVATNCFVFGIGFGCFSTTSWFFIFSAQTTAERSDSFVFACLSMLMFLWYLMCFWYKQEHVGLFDEIDAIIEKRK